MKLFSKTKSNNKGFTLVELIVVLVILSVLSAILVPALLGYIDEAKGKQTVLSGKSCYTASQAAFSNMYATSTVLGEGNNVPESVKKNIIDMADVDDLEILNVGTTKVAGKFDVTNHVNYIVSFVYCKIKGKDAYLYNNIWYDGTPDASITGLYQIYSIK